MSDFCYPKSYSGAEIIISTGVPDPLEEPGAPRVLRSFAVTVEATVRTWSRLCRTHIEGFCCMAHEETGLLAAWCISSVLAPVNRMEGHWGLYFHFPGSTLPLSPCPCIPSRAHIVISTEGSLAAAVLIEVLTTPEPPHPMPEAPSCPHKGPGPWFSMHPARSSL